MTIDRSTRALLDAVASRGAPPFFQLTPDQARAAGAASVAAYGQALEMAAVQEAVLRSSDGGSFRIRVLRPSGVPDGTILYVHGGGWVLGDIDSFNTLGSTLAATSNFTVILVDYRKAPEHPFPAGLDDVWTALCWADDRRGQLARNGADLLIAGDSAGANLCIAAALRARDAGDAPKIDGGILVYPVTDSDFDRPSYLDTENQLMLSRQGMQWFFEQYIGDGDATRPEISPLRTDDVSGFPPSFILLAEHDPLRDEGHAFADRLRLVGSLLGERVYPGQMHGFFSMINVLPASNEAIDDVARLIRSTFLTTQEVTR